ncbi:MAG: glycosyltransferase [Sulfurihydrogenibium sp.]|uniref:glycosyltransferase n=1 Tax=Sulfurihydrogenibium sp. TaxID=2053621 RepID=UPI003D102F57
MKLLDITHFYSERGGGIKTYINNKINFFSHIDDIQHTLVIPGEEDDTYYNGKTKVITLKSPQLLFSKNYRLIINPLKLASIIEEEKPNIIEIGSPFIIPSVVNFLKEKLKFKVFGFFHSDLEKVSDGILKKGNLIKPLIRKYVYKTYSNMDLVIAPSNYVKRYLNRVGIYNVKVVNHGVDVDFFLNVEADKKDKIFYGIEESRTILLYVGRFSPDKNFSELLNIFKLLNFSFPDRFHFLIVGDGPLKEEIYDKLDSNYTVLDYISSKEELAKIYKMADVFVSASKNDTFGISLIEAQACGLPVVAYNVGPFPEIVYYKDLLCKDSFDFFYKIIYLSENKKLIDKDAIVNFVKNNFDLKLTMQNLLNIYRESIEVKSV